MPYSNLECYLYILVKICHTGASLNEKRGMEYDVFALILLIMGF